MFEEFANKLHNEKLNKLSNLYNEADSRKQRLLLTNPQKRELGHLQHLFKPVEAIPDNDVKSNGLDFSTDDNSRKLRWNGIDIGSTSYGNPGYENRTAKRMFPGIINQEDKVGRINGIVLHPEFRGYGIGQLQYLDMLNNSGSNWLYNSQVEEPASQALRSLHKKGLIDLHWKKHPLGYDDVNGIHIARINEKGKKSLKSRDILKSKLNKFLENLSKDKSKIENIKNWDWSW